MADLQRERERSARLEQDLEAARRDAETQTALAAKASEEASRLKGTQESGAAELQSVLQKERERTAQLEKDLAAARHDVETQSALATTTKEEVLRQKRAADAGAAELKQARERADGLAQELSLSRSSIYAHEAQARKAADEAAELRQALASNAASVRKLTPDDREQFARQEQDLAAARRDIETQTARAAKASEEVSRLKQERESSAAELQSSLQKERERSARLEEDLAGVRHDVETKIALVTKAGEETYRLKAAAKDGAADLKKERELSVRLEQDLAAARSDVEAKVALVTKAGEEVSRLKAAEKSSAAELQKERERSARLEQDLTAAQRDVDAKTVLVTKAGEETSRLIAVGKGGAADLQKERERSARLEQDLTAARRDAETKTTLATKAAEEMARLKAEEKSAAADLQKERERSARLQQDLAAVRRDVETQTARAAKASDEAALQKQAAEAGAAELKQSRARAADAQVQSLSLARSAIRAYEVQGRKTGNEAAGLGQATANGTSSLRKAAEIADGAERLGQNLAPVPGAASDLATTGSTARDKPIEVATNPVAGVALAAPARGIAQPEQAAEAVALVARASSLLRQGDVSAARLVLERAVEMGSAQASFALAETYDPLILAKWGTYGTRGDARRAKDLYGRADAAGIQEAKSRLDALGR